MSWKNMKFIDFILLQRGHDLTKEQIKPGIYPVVTSTSIMGFHNAYKAEGPGVVTGRSGTIGEVQYIKDNYWPHNTSLYVKDFKGNYPLFVYYFMKNFGPSRAKSGSAVPTLNRNSLSGIDVCIPDIKTQNKIADILSTYDNLIENNKKQIKLLEEAAQRLYKEWFTDLHFPGYENTKITDGIPDGWRKRTLEEIATVKMGQSPKSEFYNNKKQGLPFHQGVGSYGDRFVEDTVYSTSYTQVAEANSILFSVRAPVGRLNITKNKVVIGRGLAAINHKSKLQSFLFYMLKEKFFKEDILGNGSIFASITRTELLTQHFLYPTEEIAKNFDDIANQIDKKISLLDSQLKELKEARDRLLPKLMSGEIEV